MKAPALSLRTDVSLFYWLNIEPKLRPVLIRWQLIVGTTITMLAALSLVEIGWGSDSYRSNETASMVSQPVACPAASKVLVTGNDNSQDLPWEKLLWYDRRVLRSRRVMAARKKVKRTRAEIERERQELLKKTKREIDALVAEFHAKLPRGKAESIGAIYARFSSRFQDSIADQVRTLFEEAVSKGIFIPRENIFFDMAVRGWKDRRPGLTALRSAVKLKSFHVFLVFTTSRLFRRNYKAMQFVEEELVERGIRAIFVKSNLDTADGDDWRTMFQLLATMDEAAVRMHGPHVRASHEGLFDHGMICTSIPVGYTGEEVPGEFTKQKRPRRRIIIDRDAEPWIKKIFDWYVVEGKSLDGIARDLNDDDNAPAPAKSLTGMWTHALVRSHLQKPEYRGHWRYGVKETTWLSGRDYAKQTERPEPLKEKYFEDLRIVSDEVWYRAQELLAAEKAKSGRKSKDGDSKSRPRLLRGLFVCPEHQRQLTVSGAYGKILVCPLCRALNAADRPLFTHLNRKLALELTCWKLAELIQADEDLVGEIVSACQNAVETSQQPDPAVERRLRSQLEKVNKAIEFNRRNPGETEEEQHETRVLLKELGRQRAPIQAKLASLDARQTKVIRVPSAEEVAAMFDDLATTLATGTATEDEEEMRQARRIIHEMTGGRIELFQMGERKKSRGWLQGRFRIDVVSVAMEQLTGVRFPSENRNELEIIIDYKKSMIIDEQADEAKRLWDQGLLNKLIAKEMGLLPSYITKLLNHWHDTRGLPRPDNRRRRATLDRSLIETPKYQQIADEVVRLSSLGLSDLAVGRELGVSGFVVGKAYEWWHAQRDLPIPTAADRRRERLSRAREMLRDNVPLKEIAKKIGYSTRGLKLALREYLAELGEEMPDGRSRRTRSDGGASAPVDAKDGQKEGGNK